MNKVYIHKTAEVSSEAKIGQGTKIWNDTQVREKTKIGQNCILGKNVYIDKGVEIGSNCKVQNNASIFQGARLEEGVFIGPNVILANDKNPRAINPSGSLKKETDWKVGEVLIKKGASVGASSVILPQVTVGQFATIGAGSVVTRNIPDFGLVYGNPARLCGFVCRCGHKARKIKEEGKKVVLKCQKCKGTFKIDKNIYDQIK